MSANGRGRGMPVLSLAPAVLLGAGTVALLTQVAFAQAPAPGDATGTPPVFTAAQAELGAQAFAHDCAACHGAELQGSAIGPALKGAALLDQWGGAPAHELVDYIRTNMPPAAAGSLDDAAYAAVFAFLMRENGVAPADHALAADSAALAGQTIPRTPPPKGQFADMGLGGMSTSVPIPEWPAPPRSFRVLYACHRSDARRSGAGQLDGLAG